MSERSLDEVLTRILEVFPEESPTAPKQLRGVRAELDYIRRSVFYTPPEGRADKWREAGLVLRHALEGCQEPWADIVRATFGGRS